MIRVSTCNALISGLSFFTNHSISCMTFFHTVNGIAWGTPHFSYGDTTLPDIGN
ncbi:hypothetical protein BDB01DRAFT_216978 [Pilobolus umbonatus]|nr:hypothetical protein BDB01DRAFT_216978 [Pilobolus umbonatus]